MDSVISTAIFDIAILLFIFLNKKNESLIYDVTPEEEWSDEINEFNRNKKIIDDLDLSNYKLGTGHLYENA